MELLFDKNKSFEESYIIKNEENTIRVEIDSEHDIYLEGSLFYETRDVKSRRFEQSNIQNEIRELFSRRNISEFIETVEGVYVIFYIDKKNEKITIFNDKLKTKDIYYLENEQEIHVSTGLNALRSKAKGRNQLGIISASYLYIPRKHTIFDNIFRLRYNEFIELKKSNFKLVSYEEEPLQIETYTDNKIEEFQVLLENAILSRASNKLNIVQMSGGWDSSFILAVLIKHLGSDKVKGVTVEHVLPNGTAYNTYEIEKVKKIAKYMNVELDIVNARLGGTELLDLWKNEIKEKISDHELYHASLFPMLPLTKHIKDKYGDDVVVFNGEACDSMNNLGFSQYATIAHEHKGFGEYSDKMLCYLYGPTFFRKILDNTYEEDIVFKIFKWYHSNLKFVDTEKMSNEDRIFEYLFSFMFSPSRVPFAQLENSEFIKEKKFAEFRHWIRTNYLDHIIKKVTPKTLYYWLFMMYIDFHWQSPSNIRKVTESLRNIRLPYLDYHLLKFFAKMPESWGRGLELNNAKYPLKRVIHDGIKSGGLRYPLEIIEASVQHAYNASLRLWPREFLNNSVISNYYIGKGKLGQTCENLISDEYFDKDKLLEYVRQFEKDPNSVQVSSFNWRLLTFLMIAE